jgi:RNA polymerase sigma-70 factor, ECF subfamily
MDFSDAHLVRKTLAGSNPAFDQLVVRYQRQAVAVAYRLLGNLHDALEVTQDAFLKAFSNLHMLRQADAFGGWLMRIVSNLSLNFRRNRGSRTTVPLDDSMDYREPAADPLHRLECIEMGTLTSRALQRLPEKQRTALALFTLEDQPQKQIAEYLGCSIEAVKWHVFDGRRKLRQSLGEYF